MVCAIVGAARGAGSGVAAVYHVACCVGRALGGLKPLLGWVGMWVSLALGCPGGKGEAAQRSARHKATGPVWLQEAL